MIVYTAVYGGYDPLRPHPEHPGVEAWLCYTDDPDLQCEGWITIHEPPLYSHPRLSAKWRKCHPPAADSTLWVDGSVWIQDPAFIDVVGEQLNRSSMTMFSHPWRDCIYEEVGASIGMLKYQGLEDAMARQVQHYASNGWKPHAGLWASTVIGRRSYRPVAQLGAAWFAHCEAYTYQDQLSLPYLLDRYGIYPAALPHSLADNPWFIWASHNRDD